MNIEANIKANHQIAYPLKLMMNTSLLFIVTVGRCGPVGLFVNNKLASAPRVEGLNPLADFLLWRMYRVQETKNVSFGEEEEEDLERVKWEVESKRVKR